MKIKDLNIVELYYYEKMCETIIDKLVTAINLEKGDKYATHGSEYIETENEKLFKTYTNIYNKLINEGKERLLKIK